MNMSFSIPTQPTLAEQLYPLNTPLGLTLLAFIVLFGLSVMATTYYREKYLNIRVLYLKLVDGTEMDFIKKAVIN